MKASLYRMLLFFFRILWKSRGYRKIYIAGHLIKLAPESDILLSWVNLLFSPFRQKKIVSYTDHVQMNALIRKAEMLPDSPVIMDIGAYHGLYAIPLGKIIQQKSGKMIAVEPVSRHIEILRKNVRLNHLENTVEIVPWAAGDHQGETWVHDSGSQSYVHPDQESGEKVSLTGIDDLLVRNGVTRLDMLIIDVEGAELKVLKSFPWDSLPAPFLFCEMHPYNWENYGYTGEDVTRFLSSHHLKCIDMYFQEHKTFTDRGYIGPCLLLPE